MDVLAQLLSLENIILCLAIVALVWMQRKSLELAFPKLTEETGKLAKWWREFFVPLGPLGSGALLMLIPLLPVPEMFDGNLGTRMIFGVGLGLVSGLVYRLIKKNLLERLNKEEDNNTYL